ncbi:RNA polymerase sigma factor [Pedobacter miscanthi]|uniref:RNA polymerase sigma factor n=1 Tax=Pedobacter miscanthi TaxID=2259170 RepID=A0A366L4X1_9SPHI|nr:sigma-70 family RNA polymerase sigma factor [Pedobacter miscanthi]RBQ08931.1 RNA polymerase sigma factor [Pedobacter miscanthi]
MTTSAPTVIFFKESVPQFERELIYGLKSAEAGSFNKLYKMYASSLLGFIMQVVKQQETAEDLLQECFIKISRNIQSYDPDKSRLFTWMLNIARNSAIDHIRRRSSQNEKYTFGLESIGNEIENRFTHYPNTDTIGMKNLVATLSPKHRLIVDMVYFQGYTHSEAAEALDMPLGSIKTSLRYAMLTLRRFFCMPRESAA